MLNALDIYNGALDQAQMRQIRAQQADQSLQQTANQTGLAQFGMLKDIVALKNQQEQMAAMRGALSGGGQPDLERVGQAMLASGNMRGSNLIAEGRKQKAEAFSERDRSRRADLMAQIEARKAAAAEAAAGNAPVQTYTDGQGVLWEKPRGRDWIKARIAGGQGEMTPKPQVAGVKSLMKASEQSQTLDAITRQIDELDAHISKNEGMVSGTVGPKGLANRLYEVGAGVAGVGMSTPALETQSKKELLIANIRKMVSGSGVFTNKDADRVEAAIGVGIMANPANTKRALADLRTFVNEKRASVPAASSQSPSGKKPRAEDYFRD